MHGFLPRGRWAVLSLSLACFALAPPVRAQQHGDAALQFASETWGATFFNPGGTYDPAIPPPEAVLGFPVGSRPARFDEIRRYFEALDAASPRVMLFPHARTHEGRELFYLVIGSEGRMQAEALAALRERLARFADPRQEGPDAPAPDLPAVAWMGYSIHGDELSGCDAALQVAYQMAAGTDAVTRALRDSLVVLIDPSENPDGRERYLAQMRAANGGVPNPDDQSLQHRGFWPWGRGNHYLFDINRDWFTLVHPETRGRVQTILSWHPQLVVDAHEMGGDDTFLFSPPRAPFNPHLPASIHRWWDVFASDQAAAFDRRGWSHYTREWNEEFFPGYGSSWAMYSGSIGILYEQASTDGSVLRQPDGGTLSYRDAVQHQFQSSLANLESAMRHRGAILRDYRAGRRHAVENGKRGPLRAFVYVPGSAPDRALHLTRTLTAQGIEVQRATAALTLSGANDYWGGSWRRKELPVGTYVVLLDQPLGPLARNLFEFHIAMPDSFLREERDYLERGKGTRLYEVTSWSMPLAYGLETYWTAETPRGALEPVGSDPALAEAAAPPHTRPPSYAYVIDGSADASMSAVSALLSRGFAVRVALEDFRLGGRTFPRGSALLRVHANPDSLHAVIPQVERSTGVRIDATDSARAQSGPDLGGNLFAGLAPPRLALLCGNPVSFTSYGALWHLFDHDLRMRVSSLDVQGMEDFDLSKYNVIVMPDASGGGSAYSRALGPAGVDNLRTWVQAGGTLVTIGAGTAFATDSTQALSKVRQRHDVLGKHAPLLSRQPLPEGLRMDALGDAPALPVMASMPVLGVGARRFVEQVRPPGVRIVVEPERKTDKKPTAEKEQPAPYDLSRADARLRLFRPRGTIVRADIDVDHWLTGGVASRLPVLANNDMALIARDPVRVAARFAETDSLHLSGLLWPEAASRLARTAVLTRESLGKGQIILFAIDPTLRRAMRGSERLMLNAVLLGPGAGTSRPAPW
ncbi:MAG TPA: M14 family metallopeptidase [Candidatus Krumholzibacteria bacterium]|nr:M14 family metallopeptidase [Candidatus Krumholzibacteria bacterium]